jgi:hypothetical protein
VANLYKPDGTIEVIHPANGKHWTTKELQELVGGYVEVLPSIKPKIVVNEEGLLKALPYNENATQLYLQLLSGKELWYIPRLVGNVVALTPGEKWKAS